MVGLDSNKNVEPIQQQHTHTHTHSAVAYSRRVRGTGKTHREREAELVPCPVCGMNLQRKSMKGHMRHRHKEERTEQKEREDEATGVFVSTMGKNSRDKGTCPVPGCGARITQRYGMRRHFGFRHPMAAVHFPDEGPLQECLECGMKVPNLVAHKGNQLCIRMRERKMRRLQEESNRRAMEVEFKVGGQKIERVPHFKYLGRIVAEDDDDWPSITANIRKARERWAQVARVLVREDATARTMGYFYKTIVQAVLLYAAETWVPTERAMVALNSFHHRCARYIAGDHIRQKSDGEWILPCSEEVLAKCGMFSIEEYIRRRKQTIENYVVRRPIYQTCLSSIASAGFVNQKVWWE